MNVSSTICLGFAYTIVCSDRPNSKQYTWWTPERPRKWHTPCLKKMGGGKGWLRDGRHYLENPSACYGWLTTAVHIQPSELPESSHFGPNSPSFQYFIYTLWLPSINQLQSHIPLKLLSKDTNSSHSFTESESQRIMSYMVILSDLLRVKVGPTDEQHRISWGGAC